MEMLPGKTLLTHFEQLCWSALFKCRLPRRGCPHCRERTRNRLGKLFVLMLTNQYLPSFYPVEFQHFGSFGWQGRTCLLLVALNLDLCTKDFREDLSSKRSSSPGHRPYSKFIVPHSNRTNWILDLLPVSLRKHGCMDQIALAWYLFLIQLASKAYSTMCMAALQLFGPCSLDADN